MDETVIRARKQTLDKDLDKFVQVEEATSLVARGLVGPGAGFLFLVLAGLLASFYVVSEPRAVIVVAAAALGAYLALNIGANDVANNIGPAVGARALTMGGALAMAAIFESAGALISGGDVVDTVADHIIDAAALGNPDVLIRAMVAALISSALWINFATWIGAPVSTTHSVVGGVVGAGIVAAGFDAVHWDVMARIAASWVISPVMGSVIAVATLAFIESAVIYQEDKIASARRWVPLMLALMAGAFSAYIADKGFGGLVSLAPGSIAIVGLVVFLLAWAAAHPFVRRQSRGMENRNQSLRSLFHLPLIVSAALLSYAHGANDVANAVGPLAAIVEAARQNAVAESVPVPLWVMLIGAFGISFGLLLFGPRLVRMVGGEITKLNPMRAFCVALSAAVTVIVASSLGMPVSSTHTTVGAVFGVGFFREWSTANSRRRRRYLERKAGRLRAGPAAGGSKDTPFEDDEGKPVSREEIRRRKLVRRAHVRTIVAAWVTTVPAAAGLAAGVFLLLQRLA